MPSEVVKTVKKHIVTTLSTVLVCNAATNAADYPTRPIRMLTGFIAGGGSDIAARAVAMKLPDIFGQSVVVDNRPGATGAIAGDRKSTHLNSSHVSESRMPSSA